MSGLSGLPGIDLDRRPVMVALAGPNGAGKTTFYYSHLQLAGLRFVNADVVARELGLEAYAAARLAGSIRGELVSQRESFVFETVFSDPVGEKLAFIRSAAQSGYNTIVCFIGTPNAGVSADRVAMRVLQGGHDVPFQKVAERFPRILGNLKVAMAELPVVLVFDNSYLRSPFRLVAVAQSGRVLKLQKPVPRWLSPLLPQG